MLSENIKQLNGKRVLIAPLDWGLGHASRCIPIIEELINQGFEPILAIDGISGSFLKNRFPKLQSIAFPGLKIKYSSSSSQIFAILRQIPKILITIRCEHSLLDDIISKYNIDIVISDNRFGLFSRKAHCVYITHQLMIKLPRMFSFAEPLLHSIHKKIILKFNQCWIPDYQDPNSNLSGDLSHKYPIPSNASFVGPLSRFSNQCLLNLPDIPSQTNFIVISGVEPHRTILENAFIACFNPRLEESTLIVRGLPFNTPIPPSNPNVKLLNNIPDSHFFHFFSTSTNVFCRSGYTTIMDLDYLKVSANIIPTPGQTEQEYLAIIASNHTYIPQSKIASQNNLTP